MQAAFWATAFVNYGLQRYRKAVEDEDRATRVGLRLLYRSYGEENESELEEFGDYEFSANFYLTYRF